MKENIIGRIEEQRLLGKIYASEKSEFVAVCGRRRVGKTFLVREYFEQELLFQTAGLAHEGVKRQIKSFYEDLVEAGLPRGERIPKDWIEAFSLLRKLIKDSDRARKVILLDELPWMDTPKSGFVSALEHFWNSWASARHDVVLIVCGSATSWMMDKLINNHGGLHNRLTQQIFLLPFTLRESEEFLRWKGFSLSRYEIAECYMILGGIPYYLDMLDTRLSLAQNIDQLLFRTNGALAHEFSNLYAALFKNSEEYVKVVEALGARRAGLTRNEIIDATGIVSGKGLTTVLRNLESCGFVKCYRQYDAPRAGAVIYQLVDFFTLFYFHFLQKKSRPIEQWMSLQGKTEFFSWAGFTFEMLVQHHMPQVKNQLGIAGIQTQEYAWRCADAQRGAQIDMVIDRADNTVNICEIKFSVGPFSIDKDYEMNLRNKLLRFMQYAKKNKSMQLTLITTFGLVPNSHSGVVNNEVTLDDLFA